MEPKGREANQTDMVRLASLAPGRGSERSAEFVPVNHLRCDHARAKLGGAMPTDLLGPPGWRSGSWPHDGEVAGGAVAISF